jgi:hypothetical protein
MCLHSSSLSYDINSYQHHVVTETIYDQHIGVKHSVFRRYVYVYSTHYVSMLQSHHPASAECSHDLVERITFSHTKESHSLILSFDVWK